MPDKFNIPDSFQPSKKVFTTPQVINTVVRTKVLDGVKRGIIKPQIDAKRDFFPDASVKSAMLGTNVVDQLTIKLEVDTVVGPSKSDSTYIKLDAVTMVVTQSKNIVKTPIQGRNVTIKEYISDGDYDITIKGVITSTLSGRSPAEDLDNLVNLMSVPNEIVLVSDYLALFKIQYVVVESYNV